MRRLISSGSLFEREAGYSRAVVQGDWCFVAGTTGYDYRTMTMPEGVGAQAEQAFETVARTLEEAGFALGDVVRANYVLRRAADWPAFAAVAGRMFAQVRPAATCIVAELIAPEMLVEIEVTAFRQARGERLG